jgi:hypothetical protein
MATTTNYSWTTPDDTALVKDGAAAIRSLGTAIDTTVFNNAGASIAKTIVDAKGDLIVATAADTVARLASSGTNNDYLVVDTSTATGLKWATPTGGVTFAGCSVTASADQTIANNTYTTLTFNQETYDTDGFHSTSSNTGRFTVPAGKAGYYSIYAQVVFNKNVAINNGDLRIMKNGSVLQYSGEVGGTTAAIPTINFNLIANLAVADYLEIQVSQESGGNLTCFTSSSTGYAVYQFTYLGA